MEQLQLGFKSQYLPRMMGVDVYNTTKTEKLAVIYFFPKQFETPSARDTAAALKDLLVQEITDLSGKLGHACILDMKAVRDDIVRPALASSVQRYSMDSIEEALSSIAPKDEKGPVPMVVHEDLPTERLTVADYVRTQNDRNAPLPQDDITRRQ